MAHFTTKTKQACYLPTGVGDNVSVLIKDLKTGRVRTYLVKRFDTNKVKSLTALEKYCKDEANHVSLESTKAHAVADEAINATKPKVAAAIEYCQDNAAEPCNLTTADKLLIPHLQVKHSAGVSTANTPSSSLSPVLSDGIYLLNKRGYTDHQIAIQQQQIRQQQQLHNSWAGYNIAMDNTSIKAMNISTASFLNGPTRFSLLVPMIDEIASNIF